MVSKVNCQDNAQGLRALILERALELFSTKGYFNTSVHDIRKAADISIGSIYHYFPSKEAIAKAIYDDFLEGLGETMTAIIDSYDSTAQRCRVAIRRLFEIAETDPAAMEFIIHAKHRDFLPDHLAICSALPFTLMKDMVEQGIERGDIRQTDPVIASAVLFGGPIRLICLRLDGIYEESLVDQLEDVWQLAWRAVEA